MEHRASPPRFIWSSLIGILWLSLVLVQLRPLLKKKKISLVLSGKLHDATVLSKAAAIGDEVALRLLFECKADCRRKGRHCARQGQISLTHQASYRPLNRLSAFLTFLLSPEPGKSGRPWCGCCWSARPESAQRMTMERDAAVLGGRGRVPSMRYFYTKIYMQRYLCHNFFK
jgi:hypothetical protein